MITTAGKVATELRKLADALDKEPEALTVRADIYFSCTYDGDNGKAAFLNLARMLPRPFAKYPDQDRYWLKGGNESVSFHLYIERSAVCTLKKPAQPAEYECPSILSELEEAALGKV